MGGGDDERKGGPSAGRAVELDAAAMSADDVLDDRKPQAGTLGLSGETIVDAIELLEDALVLRVRNARAVVLHGDANAAIGGMGADFDAARFAPVFVGIGEKIDDGVDERVVVGEDDRKIGGDFDLELDVAT